MYIHRYCGEGKDSACEVVLPAVATAVWLVLWGGPTVHILGFFQMK